MGFNGTISQGGKRNAWLDAIFGPEQSAQDYVRAHGIRVAELMTRPPITVDADTSLDKVVHLMERHYVFQSCEKANLSA